VFKKVLEYYKLVLNIICMTCDVINHCAKLCVEFRCQLNYCMW